MRFSTALHSLQILNDFQHPPTSCSLATCANISSWFVYYDTEKRKLVWQNTNIRLRLPATTIHMSYITSFSTFFNIFILHDNLNSSASKSHVGTIFGFVPSPLFYLQILFSFRNYLSTQFHSRNQQLFSAHYSINLKVSLVAQENVSNSSRFP